jgi:hypothetical protein
MRNAVFKTCKACVVCKEFKKRQKKYDKLLPKEPECIPWHILCIDLIGPCRFGKGKYVFQLQCLTMIDPATGWFEIVEVPKKRADYISNLIEINGLTRYPWPTKINMDRGSEFAAEVRKMLNKEYPIKHKLITT